MCFSSQFKKFPALLHMWVVSLFLLGHICFPSFEGAELLTDIIKSLDVDFICPILGFIGSWDLDYWLLKELKKANSSFELKKKSVELYLLGFICSLNLKISNFYWVVCITSFVLINQVCWALLICIEGAGKKFSSNKIKFHNLRNGGRDVAYKSFSL